MADRVNLADPDFELSDAQRIDLATRAFADAKERHERALAKLRVQIAEERQTAFRDLETRLSQLRDKK